MARCFLPSFPTSPQGQILSLPFSMCSADTSGLYAENAVDKQGAPGLCRARSHPGREAAARVGSSDVPEVSDEFFSLGLGPRRVYI